MSLRTKFPILSLNDKWEYISLKFKCPKTILSLLQKTLKNEIFSKKVFIGIMKFQNFIIIIKNTIKTFKIFRFVTILYI